MSIIFQSLQKLDVLLNTEHMDVRDPMDSQAEVAPAGRKRMRLVLFATALAVVLGFGGVYAVQQINDRSPWEAESPTRRSQMKPVALESAADGVDYRSPAPLLKTSSVASESREVELNTDIQTRFYPPETPADHQPPPPSAALTERSFNSSEMAGESGKTAQQVASRQDTPVAESDNHPATSAEELSLTAAGIEARERQRRAAIEKGTRIARLVRQIEQTITVGGDPHHMEKLLCELGRIKGLKDRSILTC